MLTQAALGWLNAIDTLVLRTNQHPTVDALPGHLTLISFDELYEQHESFDAVYAEIISRVLEMGRLPQGVTYAVPGHPFVAEATCPEISKTAKAEGLPVRVIHGLSFLEPTFSALGLDPFPDLVLVDAMQIGNRQTAGFPPSSPALVAQIYSREVASDVKLTLMSAYPDEHPVTLIHGAGTKAERVEDLPLHAVDRSPHLGLLSSLFVYPLSDTASFESFQEIIARLRAPGGCPWDREQTHLSLRPFLLEEAYEALEALDRESMTDLAEELGDLLLQIVLHAQIATEEGDFNLAQVIDGVGRKLIRRHPHVFSEEKVAGVSGVVRKWEAIKAEERRENGLSNKEGLLDGVPRILPALSQAQEIIERVGRVDFNTALAEGSPQRLREQLSAFEEADDNRKLELFGELLLTAAALAYHDNLDAESALRQRLAIFRARFAWMEAQAADLGKALPDLEEDERQRLWVQSRRALRSEDGE